jgi:hypothetical protein
MKKFTKADRSTWRYFWAHWCAFQMVAITLGVWKFKYLFHDWYKPWLKMFGVPYEKIQRFHRTHSNHHLEWWEDYMSSKKYWFDFDWDALIIDWECSQYTKESCPRNARQEMEYVLQHIEDDNLKHHMSVEMPDRLKELGL